MSRATLRALVFAALLASPLGLVAPPASASTVDTYAISSIAPGLRALDGAATSLSLQNDELPALFSLGFQTTFFGQSTNVFWVSSNGFITLLNPHSPGDASGGQAIPDPNDPNGLVAGFWTDLDPSAGGSVSFENLPAAAGSNASRVMVVEYRDVPVRGHPEIAETFQIHVLDDGTYEVHVDHASAPNGTFATMGMENEQGTVAALAARGALNVVGQSLRFTPTQQVVADPPLGYTVSNVAFRPIALDAGATVVNPSSFVDDNSFFAPLGFSMSYFGEVHSNVFMSSNGFVSFRDAFSGCCSGQIFPDPASPNGVVAGYWSDLFMDPGTMRFETLPAPAGMNATSVAVFEWSHAHFCCSTSDGDQTFQIHVYDNGLLEIHLSHVQGNGNRDVSIGMEDGAGSRGILVANGRQVAFDDVAVRFLPDGLVLGDSPPGGAPITFAPDRGHVNDTIVFSGSNFTPEMTVFFGGVAAPTEFVNETTLLALVPAVPGFDSGVVGLRIDGANGTTLLQGGFLLQAAPPTLASVDPVAAPTGTLVTLRGTDFRPGAFARFGGGQVPTDVLDAGTAQARVPSALGPGNVTVTMSTLDQQESNALTFLVTAPPQPRVDSVSPLSGPVGTFVSVTGVNLGGVSVLLNGATPNGPSVANADGTFFGFTVNGTGSGPRPLEIRSGNDTLFSGTFTITVQPTIRSLSPSLGPVGTIVRIEGDQIDGDTLVRFGSRNVTDVRGGGTGFIDVVVPGPQPTTGPVDVAVRGFAGATTVASGAFEITSPPPPPPPSNATAPSPTSASPGVAAAGDGVLVTGHDFAPDAEVLFRVPGMTMSGQTTFLDAQHLRVLVPDALPVGRADVIVDNGCCFPNAPRGTLFDAVLVRAPAPQIQDPTSADVFPGDAIRIVGRNFQEHASVQIGGARLFTSFFGSTLLGVTVPDLPRGAYDIVVSNPDGQSVALLGGIMIEAHDPILAALTPDHGPAGSSVLATGFHFRADDLAVFLDGTLADAAFVDADHLRLVVPDLAPGPHRVLVANPDGRSSGARAFTITAPPPVVASVSPDSALPGATLVVSGRGFVDGATVRIAGQTLRATVTDAGALEVRLPSDASAGATSLVVTNPDGQKGALPGAFVVASPAPAISVVTPASARIGEPFAILGAGFAPGARVFLGGAEATVTRASATNLTAFVPASAGGTVSVHVVNPDGASILLGNAFEIVRGARIDSITTSVAMPGDTVGVIGAGFEPTSGALLDGRPVSASFASPTRMSFRVPDDATQDLHDVTIVSGGRADTLRGALVVRWPANVAVRVAIERGTLQTQAGSVPSDVVTGQTLVADVSNDGGEATPFAFVAFEYRSAGDSFDPLGRGPAPWTSFASEPIPGGLRVGQHATIRARWDTSGRVGDYDLRAVVSSVARDLRSDDNVAEARTFVAVGGVRGTERCDLLARLFGACGTPQPPPVTARDTTIAFHQNATDTHANATASFRLTMPRTSATHFDFVDPTEIRDTRVDRFDGSFTTCTVWRFATPRGSMMAEIRADGIDGFVDVPNASARSSNGATHASRQTRYLLLPGQARSVETRNESEDLGTDPTTPASFYSFPTASSIVVRGSGIVGDFAHCTDVFPSGFAVDTFTFAALPDKPTAAPSTTGSGRADVLTVTYDERSSSTFREENAVPGSRDLTQGVTG